jgi:transposase-like protein
LVKFKRTITVAAKTEKLQRKVTTELYELSSVETKQKQNKTRNQYSNKFKQDVINWHTSRAIVSVNATAKQFRLDRTTVKLWLKQSASIAILVKGTFCALKHSLNDACFQIRRKANRNIRSTAAYNLRSNTSRILDNCHLLLI